MRLLFDENLSFKLCHLIADLFPGSGAVGQLGLSRASDRTVWEFAEANGYTLVSHDSDFAEMAALLGPPPKVIWLRCGNRPTGVIEPLLRDHAEVIAAFDGDEAAALLEIY